MEGEREKEEARGQICTHSLFFKGMLSKKLSILKLGVDSYSC